MVERVKAFLQDLRHPSRLNAMQPSGGSIISETACAYVHSGALPPHPGPNWTRFVCISDNHSWIGYNLPPGDVLLHAGDLSSWGYPDQVMTTLNWIESLDYPVKMCLGCFRLTDMSIRANKVLQHNRREP